MIGNYSHAVVKCAARVRLYIEKRIYCRTSASQVAGEDFMRLLTFALILAASTVSLLPRVVVAQGRLSPQQDARLNEATRLQAQARQLRQQGKAREAVPLAEQALAIRKELLGLNHRDTATSLNLLGLLLKGQGNLSAARPYYEQALEIRKQVLGLENAETAVSLDNLGILLQEQGDFAAAWRLGRGRG